MYMATVSIVVAVLSIFSSRRHSQPFVRTYLENEEMGTSRRVIIHTPYRLIPFGRALESSRHHPPS